MPDFRRCAKWMCEQALRVLKTGPIFSDGVEMPWSGDTITALKLYPAADGVQHCGVTGMRDTLNDLAIKLPK